MMTRRELLATPGLMFAAAGGDPIENYYRQIHDGFVKNARRTSNSFAVCDFEGGRVLPGAVGKSKKTYDSVTRMLPAIAAHAVAGGGEPAELPVLMSIFRDAFNPDHPDYWLPSPAKEQQQRQVESSIVAWSLWLVRDLVLPKLTPAERTNIQNWLASCTQVPVRHNNWAWFTAVNQAVRLDLAGKWKEFSGDEKFMLDDVKFLNTLAVGDGWYSDSPKTPMYDYYNFWVFASHFLYWNKIAGAKYPDLRAPFLERLQAFLKQTPYFFGSNGSHVLFGRSLIYRFAVLTPLVLAHEQGLWPHSPGLLRRIVNGNLKFHFDIGGFDAQRGKLRESYSPEGTLDIRDSYIDNGHPYWGMQAFGAFLIRKGDPFWSAREEPLPVERSDFVVKFPALKMLLAGVKSSGQVRWIQALNSHTGADYRDKYTKLEYSSHLPFNVFPDKEKADWSATLILRDPQTGRCYARSAVTGGELLENGVETRWRAGKFEIVSRVEHFGEFTRRTHTINGAVGLEAIDGALPLPLGRGEEPRRDGHVWRARNGMAVASWGGTENLSVVDGTNVIYPRSAVSAIVIPIRENGQRVVTVHFASPKARFTRAIQSRAEELLRI